MRIAVLIILSAPAMLFGCDGGSGSGTPPPNPAPPQGPGPASTLVVESGDGQVINQHSVVSQPLTVRAIDTRGNGIPNVEV
jgi:hypothetical protein